MGGSASGGKALRFEVYPYEDHSRLVVTLHYLLPAIGRSRVLGSIRLGIGRKDLAALESHLAVRLVAVSILNALAEDADRPKAPAPLDRGHGVEHVAGQLRLDLPE